MSYYKCYLPCIRYTLADQEQWYYVISWDVLPYLIGGLDVLLHMLSPLHRIFCALLSVHCIQPASIQEQGMLIVVPARRGFNCNTKEAILCHGGLRSSLYIPMRLPTLCITTVAHIYCASWTSSSIAYDVVKN